MKTITVTATLDNLTKVLSFIDEELDRVDCGIREHTQVSIAVEELFVNVAHYAYAPGTGDISISIDITDDPSVVEIVLTDSGVRYDPLAKDDPDVSLSAEEREVGGLGIFMVKQSMDSMSYRYENGHNIVTIRKNI